VRGPDIPTDDLYARLELPVGAPPEAVEIAWRALLKRHHPDVAGEASLESAKRINVAHDWLSDPTLRVRYDEARRKAARRGGPTSPTANGATTRTRGPAAGRTAPRRPRVRLDDGQGRPPDLDLASPEVVAFLDGVAAMSGDELDRLELADPPPIAFVASIRRFLDPGRVAALDALEEAVETRLPAARRHGVRDVVMSYGQYLLLAGFLADELSEPFRERVEERMTRGWLAAVGRARYGPQTPAVEVLISRSGRLTQAEARDLATAAAHLGLLERPWPRRVDPAEDEGLRISAELADRDAVAAARRAGVSGIGAQASGAFARVVALESSFGRAEAARLLRPWRDLGPGHSVRDGARPRHS
jgi:curved DNA-binding protein CbpA